MSAAGISHAAQDSAAAAAARKPTKRAHPGKPDIMNGPLYMQASRSVPLVRRVKRSGDGPLHQLLRWFVNNQIGMFNRHFRAGAMADIFLSRTRVQPPGPTLPRPCLLA